MDSDLGDAMAGMPQSRNRLENRRSENDEVPRGMWKIVETSTREVGVGKTEGRGNERRSREKKRRRSKEGEEQWR